MKKRIFNIFTVFCLLFTVVGFNQKAAATTGTGLSNFSTNQAAYTSGQFADVKESAWYGTDNQGTVKKVVELGIMSGAGADMFNPTGNITVAQAVKMASIVHSIYCGDKEGFTQGNPWYKVYIDYALKNGIIKSTDFSDYNVDVTHAQMAYIFANAVPKSDLGAINTVNSLPDVSADTNHSDDIFILYRAGVLMGNDGYGTFTPNSKIQRCQAAAIITRIALTGERKTFSLSPAVSKKYTDKDLFYDQYTKDGAYTDGAGNTGNYSYHIPAVNLDSADAAAVNADIKTYYMNKINDELSNMNKGYSPVFNNVSYSTYINGNCLSLLIETKMAWDDIIEYKVYNISKYTGILISNSDLVDGKSVSKEAFLNTAKADMGAKYKEMFSECKNMDGYQAQYDKTISSDNVTMNMRMFLGDNGTIKIVAVIYSMAGADYYNYVIDTGM